MKHLKNFYNNNPEDETNKNKIKYEK